MTRKRKRFEIRNCHQVVGMQKQPSFSTPQEIPSEHEKQVHQLFNKTFQYTSLEAESAQCDKKGRCGSRNCSKKAVEDWFYVPISKASMPEPHAADPELIGLKGKMNSVKDQLSSKDIHTWHAHTTRCNIAGKIIPHVKSLGAELCTQAWVKFYEILSVYHSEGLVPDRPFLSLHLCEAPGAFVTALNHFLQQQGFSHIWDWRATTLNPYHECNNLGEMIADDRLIRQTYTQWFFGDDGSGDITHPGHVKSLCQMLMRVEEEEELELMLVTADGSIDCQANPAEQESIVSRLHHCEALTTALVLAQGGALVIKMFTLFESPSVLLVFLLNIMFDHIYAIKPGTSKSGNSEVYLTCLGYRKNVKEETLWKMLDITVYSSSEGNSLCLLQPLPSSFVDEHRLCCQAFAQWQLETIHTNLQLYNHMTEEQIQHLESKQSLALSTYLHKTGLASRGHHCRQVANFHKNKSAFFLHPRPRREVHEAVQSTPGTQCQGHCSWSKSSLQYKRQTGTFQLRQNLKTMPWSDRMRMMEFKEVSQPRFSELQCKYPIENSELDELSETDTGQAFSSVRTSSLCDMSLLVDLNLMLENTDVSLTGLHKIHMSKVSF
ncbi:Cap-specific mRNA (nucleoside-2'-o-)-methyltransferase 2 [Plakobranchus ocellatus]|uniref:Cap-specific mRNA (nucleoside-2'-O-)-methyltransferase 2 n=1 Tax=Plakobranchus ocellatus TaxID=259542 RepID=A0AAV3Z0Z7_9GAST|nr:Cap-specific mRNA (nucleoside-2'-o-)-methyltransferase 2 [Plakobranchus ocellatus]